MTRKEWLVYWVYIGPNEKVGLWYRWPKGRTLSISLDDWFVILHWYDQSKVHVFIFKHKLSVYFCPDIYWLCTFLEFSPEFSVSQRFHLTVRYSDHSCYVCFQLRRPLNSQSLICFCLGVDSLLQRMQVWKEISQLSATVLTHNMTVCVTFGWCRVVRSHDANVFWSVNTPSFFFLRKIFGFWKCGEKVENRKTLRLLT